MRLLIIISVFTISLFACSPYNPVKMAGTSNPLPDTPEVVNAGHEVFKQHCVVCHGASGRGDGPAASSLATRPANLRLLNKKLEGLIAMRIARGGSVMPAWEGILKEEEIWQLTRYIKSISNEEVAAYAAAH